MLERRRLDRTVGGESRAAEFGVDRCQKGDDVVRTVRVRRGVSRHGGRQLEDA